MPTPEPSLKRLQRRLRLAFAIPDAAARAVTSERHRLLSPFRSDITGRDRVPV